MLNSVVIILSLLLIQIYSINGVTLNIICFSYSEDSQPFTPLADSFNNYSKENNLDITIKLHMLSNLNVTNNIEDYVSLLDSLFKKKDEKYDIYFYETTFITDYDLYLLDLKKIIPEEHIKMFNPDFVEQYCTINDKLIGLPVTLSFSVLYSNRNILNKYNKNIPKTWDELLDTSKYILEMERTNYNNTELRAYNGLFNDIWGSYSYYEFIYSYRDSKDSKFPDFQSETTIKALEMIKKIKNEISSDEEFKSLEPYSLTHLIFGTSIFIKYWVLAEPLLSTVHEHYDISLNPGHDKNISSSRMIGYNVGVNKNIEKYKDKLNAAAEFVKYSLSYDFQKELFIDGRSVPAIFSLFDDEDVCKVKDCDMFKNMQLMQEPVVENNIKSNFNKKFFKYANEYLYENKTLKETLSNFESISKIHYIKLDSSDSYIGLISVIIISVFSLLMILSLIVLFIENMSPYFEFLSIDLWILIIFGITTTLCSSITLIGEITEIKCQMKIFLLSIGLTMTIIPLQYKLIVNFPEKNGFSEWVKKYKYIFIIFFILIDLLLNGLSFIKPYYNANIVFTDELNFKTCELNNSFGKVFINLIILYKFITLLVTVFLVFIEWNIKSTFYDIRFVTYSIYSSILLIVMFNVINIINFNDYKTDFILNGILFLINSISNYIFLFGNKLFFAFMKKKNVKIAFINKINNHFINNDEEEEEESSTKNYPVNTISTNKDNNNNSNYDSNTFDEQNTSPVTSLISKLVNYHFATETSSVYSSKEIETNYIQSKKMMEISEIKI
ncbi:periplasmic binding protein-like II [Piromyces finnis]|uniref:Periplasmic binding protein-like II n=1 Tax=Piromyces finnis TaxID=1754191 RepID=A0A1Y1UX32_9FUNG|nr:periplasmic binding protein-like II [Piromyces finnis]|eukprot:ORX42201.1 periplasmic binding protein-like II [Piromyces finnis]